MNEIDLLKDENEYLKYLDIVTRAFRIYKDVDEKKEKVITFPDTLVKGYVEYKIENGSKKPERTLEYDCKRELYKDYGYEMRKYLKVLFSALYRKTFSIYSRELKDIIDFELVKNAENYDAVIDTILKTDTSLSEEDINVIKNVDTEKFLIHLCNQIAHGNVHNTFINEDKKKDSYIEIIEKYKQHFNIKNALIQDNGLEKLFFKDEAIKINYHSHRLNKDCQFSLYKNDLWNLLLILGTSLSYAQGSCVYNTNLAKLLTDYKNEVPNIDCYTITEKENEEIVHNLLKLYSQEKNIEYKNQAMSLMKKDMFGDIQKQVAVSKIENFIKFHQKNYLDWDDKYISHVTNCCVNNCLFNKMRIHSWFEEQGLLFMSIVKLYENCPFYPDGENNSIAQVIAGTVERFADMHKYDPYLTFLGILSNQPENLYIEILFTEVLNILQLAEKKGLWEEIGRNSSTANEIAQEYGYESGTFVVEKLRNSLQHIRFVKDKGSVQIFDGRDNDNLEFMFEIFLDELEDIKDTALNALMEYNKQIIEESNSDEKAWEDFLNAYYEDEI